MISVLSSYLFHLRFTLNFISSFKIYDTWLSILQFHLNINIICIFRLNISTQDLSNSPAFKSPDIPFYNIISIYLLRSAIFPPIVFAIVFNNILFSSKSSNYHHISIYFNIRTYTPPLSLSTIYILVSF